MKLNNLIPVLIGLLSIVIIVAVSLFIMFEFLNGGNKDRLNCQDICISNNLDYYKYTNSGYAGLTSTCYCKDVDGRISTYQM